MRKIVLQNAASWKEISCFTIVFLVLNSLQALYVFYISFLILILYFFFGVTLVLNDM